MSHKVNSSLPMTRISTRKSIEIQPNNKHSDTDTKTTGRYDRRKQTLKTILRDEAPVFLSHEEVVVSNSVKKEQKPSRSRQKSKDLSRPLLKSGLIETKARCLQVTEEVGKALRTGAWQNRKEDVGSLSSRNKQPANCDPGIINVNSAVSRKRVSTNVPPRKETTSTMLSKVRENRKASRCCAECKSVVLDREKLRLRAALGVKICDTCWAKKKPKEVPAAAQPLAPRAPSPSVKKCLVKLFDVSKYPVGHPFGKGFLSQRALKRKFNESHTVDDTAGEMIVQPKRARKNGSSTFPTEFVDSPKAEQLKDSKHANETAAKERTASTSRNASQVTSDAIASNKTERSSRRKSDQSTAENTVQEKHEGKTSLSSPKVNVQTTPERRTSRRNVSSAETVTKIRTSRRISNNNETASEKKTSRKSSSNTEILSEKTQKDNDNVETPTDKKSESSNTNAEISSERKLRRSSMSSEIASQKKTPQRNSVKTAPENVVSRRSSINTEMAGGKRTSRRSSTSTETTPARVSRRNSLNAENTSEIRILRGNSFSSETSGTRTKRQNSISNDVSKSALPVRIQTKNKSVPALLRKGHKQVISSVKSKVMLAKLETKSDRNPSNIRLTQIKSGKLRKVLPEAAVARSNLTNSRKKQLILQQNKLNIKTSRKGSVLPKYSKLAEKPRAKNVLTRKTDSYLKNRRSSASADSSKKSVFGKLHSKKTSVQHGKKSQLTEKTAASRKRKMDLSDRSPAIKKRKIENVPVRRKQTVVEKEFARTKILNYKCDACDKKYSSLAEKRLHELSHIGRQPILVLHKCDSPQGVLSLIREDDFSSLNIFGSDSEIQKDEVNMTCDGSNTEMNTDADIGTVKTVEMKDGDTDATQLENQKNVEELTEQSENKSFEIVETEEVGDTDHEQSIPFENFNTVSVLKTQEIECNQQMVHSDTGNCSPDEMDKNKPDVLLQDTTASKVQVETAKLSSAIGSPEIAKKPKSSDEIAVLLEEIFGESSEEDLMSAAGISNVRQAADTVNSSIDKTNESSTRKTPGVNSQQHTPVTQNSGTVAPKCSPSDTSEAVSQYLKAETHNTEEILRQLNYGDKTVAENEPTTSSDTDQADTNIKLPDNVELNNSLKDWDNERDSCETPCVTTIEGKVCVNDEGNRAQVNESEAQESHRAQSPEKVPIINIEEGTELSTDISDDSNLKDSTCVSTVSRNNVSKDNASDISMNAGTSLENNKDFPNSVSEDNSVTGSVNETLVSGTSCKKSQNETLNEEVEHPSVCSDAVRETSPEHKYKTDNGDEVLVESVDQEEQQTIDQEKQVLLDTTHKSVVHEIVEISVSNDKCDESETSSEQAEGSTENIENVEQTDKKPVEIVAGDGSCEIKDSIVQQPEELDDIDLLNKQNLGKISEVAKIDRYTSEKCQKNASIYSQPENGTNNVNEGTQADLIPAGNNENETSSTKNSLEDVLQNEICDDEIDTAGNGLIKDILLVENNEANEMLDSAPADETDCRNIAVHLPSEAVTVESKEIDSGKSYNDTALKIDGHNCHNYVCDDSSEGKGTELDQLAQPDVCDASRDIDNSDKENIQDTTCDVSSFKLDHKTVVSDIGHDIDSEDISTTLDNNPKVKVDGAEHEIESQNCDNSVETPNAGHEAEKVLQPETLDTDHKLQILNPSDDLEIKFSGQKTQTINDCSASTDHDTNNSVKSRQLIVQGSSKEEMLVEVIQRVQPMDSANLVDAKEGPSCEMEPLIANYECDTIEKSEVESVSTAQEIETTDSNNDTQGAVSTCDFRTDDVNCEVGTRDLSSESEVKIAREGSETANADNEVEFARANETVGHELASDEVVVALDAGSEADVLVPGDEVGAEVQFVPSSDLSANSEITAGISGCCPSLVGVENLSFNVRHTVPDVFEEEEQMLQEVGDHSILQAADCANRSVETLPKRQSEIQEAEIEDNVKSPLVVGLNGMNEKVIDECSTKMSGDSDSVLKDNLHLAVSEDNDISGLEPISDDELDFM